MAWITLGYRTPDEVNLSLSVVVDTRCVQAAIEGLPHHGGCILMFTNGTTMAITTSVAEVRDLLEASDRSY